MILSSVDWLLSNLCICSNTSICANVDTPRPSRNPQHTTPMALGRHAMTASSVEEHYDNNNEATELSELVHALGFKQKLLPMNREKSDCGVRPTGLASTKFKD